MPIDLPADEAEAFRSGPAPAPMLDLVGLMAAHAVRAGWELGLFDALGKGALTTWELAAATRSDPTGIEQLANLLHATGYLRWDDGRHANSPAAAAWLRRDSPTCYGHVLSLWHTMIEELWTGLPEAVRDGRPRGGFYTWLAARPELRATFQDLQRGLAGWLAEEVVGLVGLPDDATSLLDLGGGHGLYSEAYCTAYPALRATVVDNVRLVSGHERVTGRAADLLTGALDDGHDAVLLFNVLHGFPADDAARLVARAARALRQDGLLLVLETTASDRAGVAERAFTAGFSVNLWHTQNGRVYPEQRVEEWIAGAGCTLRERHELTRSATHTLFAAVKQAR
ncbi:methyltransferase [Nonomuraea sp. NPDC050663]|uniref:methyltransferase n=1 Tax=Nonomuraea sp. NPDC050663 TaxID=3364370 RepID=UPI0037AEE66E